MTHRLASTGRPAPAGIWLANDAGECVEQYDSTEAAKAAARWRIHVRVAGVDSWLKTHYLADDPIAAECLAEILAESNIYTEARREPDNEGTDT